MILVVVIERVMGTEGTTNSNTILLSKSRETSLCVFGKKMGQRERGARPPPTDENDRRVILSHWSDTMFVTLA